MNENVYQHFKADERETIDKIGELIAKAQLNYQPILTDFFNPRERFIAQTLIGSQFEIKMASFGGYHHADRKRVIFYPNYYQYEKSDFELALLEIKYPIKFANLHHGQILGTLANSGIRRDVIGDIITDGQNWQVLTETKISRFLIDQITHIGKVNVKMEAQSLNLVLNPVNAWEQLTLLTSSLRLDNLVSNAYHISRTRTKELINNSKVQVNWTNINKPDYLVDKLDIISVRGFGRIRLDDVIGQTRKQKFKVLLSIIKK